MTIAHRISPTLVLSSGPPLALKVLYCLRQLNVPTHLVDIGPASIARYSRYKLAYAALDTRALASDAARHELLAAYVRDQGIRAIVPADIAAAGFLHDCRALFAGVVVYPTSPMALLDQLDDKWSFCQLLRALDIPTPATTLVRSRDEIANVERAVAGYPVVVKPLFAESGRGITRANDGRELVRDLEARAQQGVLPVIVQAYCAGEDADISVFALDGEIVTAIMQAKRGADDLEFFHDPSLLEIAQRIVRGTNYSGVANIDVRRDTARGTTTVLECNPRFWYTLQAALWRGVNFVEIGLKAALGDSSVTDPIGHGRYVLHGRLCKRALWSPREWSRLPAYNLGGLAQALSDPMPFLMAELPRAPSRKRVSSA